MAILSLVDCMTTVYCNDKNVRFTSYLGHIEFPGLLHCKEDYCATPLSLKNITDTIPPTLYSFR